MNKKILEAKSTQALREAFTKGDIPTVTVKSVKDHFNYMLDTFGNKVERVSTIFTGTNLISFINNGTLIAKGRIFLIKGVGSQYVFDTKEIVVEQKSSYYYRVTWKKIKGMYVDIAMMSE